VQTIKALLDRVRWDPRFGNADFELGYWDRYAREVVRIPFTSVLNGGEACGLSLVDPEGYVRQVPLHRVRRVWRNGVLIWSRDPDATDHFLHPR
jgi:uncharacterized protein (UPF0248 family)